jgi:3-oxoacyl-(acyl-carrier-protein) synthase
MMKKTYLNGIGCISAQRTFDTAFLEEAQVNNSNHLLPIVAPPYKDFISPAASRRMATGVKIGIVASAIAIKESGSETFDAIITGTGLGCSDDSDKFLRAILDNNEEFLTPTPFIQSTHNTVGAQIALGLQCKAYNFTYVNGSVSFESALLDGKMKIDEGEAHSVLVGGVDELNDYTATLFEIAGFIRKAGENPYNVLESTTTGTVYSNGATFFVLEDNQNEHSYAKLLDVMICNRIEKSKLAETIVGFLKSNSMQVSDIDAVILGYNGDVETDQYYKIVGGHLFDETPQVYYKHLSGEYHTASAFGLYVGANIIKSQVIPEIVSVNNLTKPSYTTILLYNQYRGIDHSLTLISKC